MSLLTIAVPTYNRSKYLDQCLKRIQEEIEDLTVDHRNLVKVFVSDNSSLDDTTQVISQYMSKANVVFDTVRNDENIGVDRNFAQCYTTATTPYVWVLGDDDLIVPNGLQKVLDVLQNKEVDILYVNNYWFSDNYLEKPVRQEKHGVFRSGDPLTFARRTNVMLTFTSALIARTGVDLELSAGIAAASNLQQLGWLLPLLRDGNCFVIIDDYVVAAKGSNSGGYEIARVFGHNLKKITDNILKDKPEVAKAIQNGAIVNFFPPFVIDFRKGSKLFNDRQMSLELKEVFSGNWRYHLFIAPLFALPVSVLKYYNFATGVFRRVFRRFLV
ncbi:MAG: glycosyltransferase family 2 protein [Chlorobium sp.]|nr:glycosyltransferase family 2 protein [Chlorobium sp.]